MRAATLALLLAAGARAQVATLLVRVDAEGNITGRMAASDRYARARHEGWVRVLRPPGVCIRRALFNHRPAWVEWTPTGPVAWDSLGVQRYLRRFGEAGPLPTPRRRR